jgi:hypothetical protein
MTPSNLDLFTRDGHARRASSSLSTLTLSPGADSYGAAVLVDTVDLEETMHESKFAGFIIDCQTNGLERAADFWGSTLGMPVHELSACEREIYKRLENCHHRVHIEAMEAPGDERFCVVPTNSNNFGDLATDWS